MKGVYRGQIESELDPYASTSLSCSPSSMMTQLMKGVMRTPTATPDAKPQHIHLDGYPFPQTGLPTRTPALGTPNAIPSFYEHMVTDSNLPEHTTRDVTRASTPSVEHQTSRFTSQEISTAANKTIKITLEDAQVSTTNTNKPDQHPQEKLDQFWGVFEPEYFGKINRILPTSLLESSPAASKQAGDRSHKAFHSYEDAKARCIRDVKRIARECRAHNIRYTDPHFDIERDLKITRRRDCLDGLYNYTTSGSSSTEKYHPTDVKRVCDIFKDPSFFTKNASFDDIIQGNLGDCWLLAAFSILTCSPKLVKDICVIQDPEVGVYGFVFYRDGDWHQTIIDDKLYLRAPSYDESGDVVLGMYGVQQSDQERSYNDLFQTGSKSLYFAACRDENETWVPLLEKALAKAHGSYSALSGGQTGEAIEDLTGGVTTEVYTTNILNKDKFWYDELRKIGSEFVFSAAVASYREWRAPGNSSTRVERRQGIVSQHAYAILDTYEGHGQRLVKMRNPWGSTEWNGPWSDGSKEWTHDWIERLGHRFGDDGIFWISYEDMLRKYKYLDRTRIFGPDWHIAQQWTSVQVPWNTTDYQQTKFQVDVPNDTQAVVVISQLDDRYFQGLQGKYNYTLQFRIQKDDEEEEYLSRSPHNYELVRSNNVEVPLEKGRYTILFKVEAKKTNRKDVEAVIRENIWRKEKLMQVGTLYDLAHQKGQQNMATEKSKAAEGSDETSQKQAKEEKDKDPNRDPWNAFCVVGLRVYSKLPSIGLKVIHPEDDEETITPVLDRDDIAKAPLQEAVHNAEQTPEGSVSDGEQAIMEEKPAENVQQGTEPGIPTDSDATNPSVADTVTPHVEMQASQVMDDLSGDRTSKRS